MSVTSPRAKAPRKPVCKHCGADLKDERTRESGFCCAGCAYVHRLVHEHGLGSYYQYKDASTPPADPAVFQPRDYSWLEEAQQAAESRTQQGEQAELTLAVQGISCAGCVWLIERLYSQTEGARSIMVNAQTGEARLTWALGRFSAADFARKLQSFGYLLGPADRSGGELESRNLARRIGLCTAFAMNIMLFTLPVYFGMDPKFEYASLFANISLAFATLSFLVGGTFFLNRALRALREGQLHIDLPIAIGILGAYLGSLYGWFSHEERFVYFDFVGTFILLMLVGRWAQVVAVERNQRQLLRHQVKPPSLRLESGPGGSRSITPEELEKGQIFLLVSGQASPVEARLLDGDASVSLASINGEAEPRIYRAGEVLPSGALNIGQHTLRLEARQAWKDSLLCRLLQAGERQGSRHLLLEKIIRGYLIGIFITAVGSGLGWWLLTHNVQKTWSVVTAVLVVSCPCAVGLSFPLAEEMAALGLRRLGVFVRENDVWAKLSRVRRIAFDKTGTLTLETPELVNPELLRSLDARQSSVLFSLVRSSVHPLSQSLLAEVLALGNPAPVEADSALREEVGCGLELRANDGLWRLGKASWAVGSADSKEAPQTTQQTGSEVVLSLDGRSLAAFHFIDRPRNDSREEIDRLQAQGFSVHILSGDHPDKVQTMAKALGIPEDQARGGLSPDDKAAWVASTPGESDTLMLGDGANDTLAFDKALCRGTPVIHRGLLEQRADFFYLGRGIRGIRALFEADRIRRRSQVAIMVFSVVYNAVAVGLAIAGLMNPLVAAILMPVNSVCGLLLVSATMKPVFSLR